MKRERNNVRPLMGIWCVALCVLLPVGCRANNQQTSAESVSMQYAVAREKMVEEQIMARGIREGKIIDAFLNVERHRFVPERFIEYAYEDSPLPIGGGQTISQPYIVAYMTHVLNLSKTDRVLEIGTGSGYQAAILGELSDSVFTIEINETLGNRAARVLHDLGYRNIKVKIGDGYKGWEEYAPYDAIIVTCSPSHIPEPLKEQLKEGGRMIIPVGESYDQKLVYIEKINKELKQRNELPVLFVPMVDEKGKSY